jgi:2-haloacid dehalogenase
VQRAVAFVAMGTLFDVTPFADAMPRVLHAAAATTLAGTFVAFPDLVERLLGAEAVEALSRLDAYPDTAEALAIVREAGAAPVVLTNGSAENTRTLLDRNDLELDLVLSVEEAGAYKPDPRPYRLLCERLDLPPERVTLVAAHAWDCLGARGAGLETLWIPRGGEPWAFPPPEPRRAGSLADAARIATAA